MLFWSFQLWYLALNLPLQCVYYLHWNKNYYCFIWQVLCCISWHFNYIFLALSPYLFAPVIYYLCKGVKRKIFINTCKWLVKVNWSVSISTPPRISSRETVLLPRYQCISGTASPGWRWRIAHLRDRVSPVSRNASLLIFIEGAVDKLVDINALSHLVIEYKHNLIKKKTFKNIMQFIAFIIRSIGQLNVILDLLFQGDFKEVGIMSIYNVILNRSFVFLIE